MVHTNQCFLRRTDLSTFCLCVPVFKGQGFCATHIQSDLLNWLQLAFNEVVTQMFTYFFQPALSVITQSDCICL